MSTARVEMHPWSPLRRIAFRFLSAYFLFYSLPFPIGVIPGTGAIQIWIQAPWYAFVTWVGKVVFGLAITVYPNGSGDTTYNYVEVFTLVVVAALVTLAWSAFDRRSRSHERLYDALQVYVRFVLAATLWGYGMSKVIPLQFPAPAPDRLLSTYGESSPMGILWTFMGSSAAYTIFAGAGEVLAGTLLFFRRTATLGGLVAAAVMTNVVALNFCYDVPVKLYSSHLLAMALFTTWPDLVRLWSVLVLHQPAPARAFAAPSARRWWRITRVTCWVAFVGYIAVSNVLDALAGRAEYGSEAKRPALYGVYEVEEFTKNGVAEPALLSNAERWRRLGFNAWGGVTIRRMDESVLRFNVEIDEAASTVQFNARDQSGKHHDFRWSRPSESEVLIEGRYEADDLKLVLRARPVGSSFLETRGFHWINEYPLNR